MNTNIIQGSVVSVLIIVWLIDDTKYKKGGPNTLLFTTLNSPNLRVTASLLTEYLLFYKLIYNISNKLVVWQHLVEKDGKSVSYVLSCGGLRYSVDFRI